MTNKSCELCKAAKDHSLWQDAFCRVIGVRDADYPGYCRVVLNRHVREMTDLNAPERARLMKVVFATEAALRAVARPDKVNLASLGNAVPHLHWHVVPRWHDDRHFPRPIWARPSSGVAAPGRRRRPGWKGIIRHLEKELG